MTTDLQARRDTQALVDGANALALAAVRDGAVETCELEPGDLGSTIAEQTLAIDRLLFEVARDGLAIEVAAPKWKLADWGLHDSHLERFAGKVRVRPAARGGWLSLRFSPIGAPAPATGDRNDPAKSYRAGAREIRALAEMTRDEGKKAKLLEIVQQLEALADTTQPAAATGG